MWTPCGRRISPRPPEGCPLRLPPPLPCSTSSGSAPSHGVWRSPVTLPVRRWCWAAPSPPSSSTSPPCGSARWSWPGDGAGEGLSISGRVSSCGSTPGCRGTTLFGWPMCPPPPSGSGRGGWRHSPASVSGASTSTTAARCRVHWVTSSASPAAGRARCSTAPPRSSACRSGGRGKEPCSPPAPTCAGIPRRCWRSSTSRRATRAGLARDLAPLAVGLAELEPPPADVAGVCDLLVDSLSAFEVTRPSK